MKENRDALTRLRKEALEDKLQRAVKMRESHLQEIVRKAQEEEAKVCILYGRKVSRVLNFAVFADQP